MRPPNCPDCHSNNQVEVTEIPVILDNHTVMPILGWQCSKCEITFLCEGDFDESITNQTDN